MPGPRRVQVWRGELDSGLIKVGSIWVGTAMPGFVIAGTSPRSAVQQRARVRVALTYPHPFCAIACSSRLRLSGHLHLAG